MPAYRAANQQLDVARNTYLSEIERNFVRVMFGGTFPVLYKAQPLANDIKV